MAAGRQGELFAQLAEEYIDDLELRLVHSVIEAVKKHFLREDGTLAQAEELEEAYSVRVTGTGSSSTETIRALRLTANLPVRIVASGPPWEGRTIA